MNNSNSENRDPDQLLQAVGAAREQLRGSRSDASEQADEELARLEEGLKAQENNDIAKASDMVRAVKGNLQATINAIRDKGQPVPAELESALRDLSSVSISNAGQAQDAVALASKGDSVANAAQGAELLEDAGNAVGAIAAGSMTMMALKGMPAAMGMIQNWNGKGQDGKETPMEQSAQLKVTNFMQSVEKIKERLEAAKEL